MSIVPSSALDPSPQLEPHRVALRGHCYRMLGSATEADDAVQETMVRAWRSFERFEGRSSVKTWLLRIGTRVCLDALADRGRRRRPMECGPVGSANGPLPEAWAASEWVEPIPDARVIPAEVGPEDRLALRRSVRLAFVAALQHLPPKQRAVLLLREVLDWSAAEVAESLETTVPAVNSALQRARATLASRDLGREEPLPEAATALLHRYVDAFERYDIEALTALLHEDATLSMPPYPLWLQGHAEVRTWLLGNGVGCRGSRLVPTVANGTVAVGQYRASGPDGAFRPWSLIVLELDGDRVAAMNHFLDTDRWFPMFGLPPEPGPRG